MVVVGMRWGERERAWVKAEGMGEGREGVGEGREGMGEGRGGMGMRSARCVLHVQQVGLGARVAKDEGGAAREQHSEPRWHGI